MTKRLTALILALLLICALAAGCAEKYTINTPIGDFEMSTAKADKFKDYEPSAGNIYLLVSLAAVDAGMTLDTLSGYLRPSAENSGPIATVNGTDTALSYIAYSDSSPVSCVLIYEVPDTDFELSAVSLRLPQTVAAE